MDHITTQRSSAAWLERNAAVRSMLLATCFALLTAIGAQVSLKLPFTAVPFTLQVFFVLLSGLLLGSRLAMMSQIEYLALGFAGLPIFANQMGGPGVLAGPTAGYLLAFPLAAWIVGRGTERVPGWFPAKLVGLALGVSTIHLLGSAWLAIAFFGGNLAAAFGAGSVPFLAPDMAKAMVAAVFARRVGKGAAG